MCRWRSPWQLLLTRSSRSPWQLLLARSWSRGSLHEKLRAVPFSRDVAEAEAAYSHYHHSLISRLPSRSPALLENFLPFWAVSADVHVQVMSADLGFIRSHPVYNFRTKRYESRTSTDYKSYTWTARNSPKWTDLFDPSSHLSMQIYASFEYPPSYVDGIRSKDTFRGAQPLARWMVEDAHRLGRIRGLEEFRIRPSDALAMAKEAIIRDAKIFAKGLLKMQFGADDVRFVDLNVNFRSLSMSPIYVPAFIFESRYLGETVLTFVHGSTLETGGQRLYNASIAAVAGATVAASATIMLGETGLPPVNAIIMRILLPAAVFGFLIGFLYPLAALKWNRFRADKESASFQGMWDGALWDEEYVRPFDATGYRADQGRGHWNNYRYERKQQSKPQGSKQAKMSGDLKGYYATLGLPSGASEKEIKSAFRSLALKHHPDRYVDEKEKEQAKVRFQKITSAYEVLRDANKRKLYDETGQ